MRRRTFITGGTAGMAAVIAGCTSLAQTDTENEPSNRNPRTVTVSNSGEVESEPDLAVVRASVEETADDASTVRDALADRIESLIDGLVEYGIDEEAITTGRYRIRERVDQQRLEEDEVRPEEEEDLADYLYYVGSHELTIEIDDVDTVGEVIDTAVDGGADEIGRVQFTLSEERREELREEALEKAIDAATGEAEFVAGEVDAEIVEAKIIDTSGGGVSPVYERAFSDDVDDADSPPTELHPDDVSVSASVEITFEID